MKISRQQKEENRQAVIKAAMELIAEKGFAKVAMREIANQCKMSDAAIYNYFKSKEEMVLAAYELLFEQALQELKNTDDLGELKVHEKFHLLVTEVLNRFFQYENFVRETFSTIFLQPIGFGDSVVRLRKAFSREVNAILEEGERSGELAANPLRELTAHLFWDYLLGVIFYWLKDTSDMKTRTTELIERTTAMIVEILRVPIIQHGLGVLQFLIREHLLTRFMVTDYEK